MAGVWPAGTISLRVLVAQLVEREAAAAGEHQRVLQPRRLVQRAPAAPRERRCCSALGSSARPHCATGSFRRVAVSVSCSGLRERTCISTSPAATMGRPVSSRDALHQRRRSASSPARCSSSSAMAARSLEPGLQPHRLREHGLEAAAPASGTSSARQSGRPASEGRVRHAAFDVGRVREVARPWRARRRATVIQCDRLP